MRVIDDENAQLSDIAAVISRGGFNGLIEALRARVQRFAAAQAK